MAIHVPVMIALVLYTLAALGFLVRLFRGTDLAQKLAVITVWGAFLAHSAALVAFFIISNAPGLSGKGATLFLSSWVLVAIGIVSRRYYSSPLAGVLLTVMLAALLSSASYLAHTAPADFNSHVSYLVFASHVFPALLAEACVALAFILGILFLLQDRRLRTKQISAESLMGPSLDKLNGGLQRILAIGFIAISFAVGTGALLTAGGHVPFRFDLMVWSAIATWIVLAVLMHLRFSLRWSGRRYSRIVVFLCGTMIIAFLGLFILLGEGVHAGYSA